MDDLCVWLSGKRPGWIHVGYLGSQRVVVVMAFHKSEFTALFGGSATASVGIQPRPIQFIAEIGPEQQGGG